MGTKKIGKLNLVSQNAKYTILSWDDLAKLLQLN